MTTSTTTTPPATVCPSCFEAYALSGACGCDIDGHAPGSGRRYRVDLTKRAPIVDHWDARVLVPRPAHARHRFELGGMCHCGAAIEGRFLCPTCLAILRLSLTEVAPTVAQLDSLRTQQGIDYRTLGGATGGSQEIPWPINADAMLARDRLRQVLARLVVLALQHRLGPRRVVPSPLDPAAMARYLLPIVNRFNTRPGFETAASELASALGRADTIATPPGQRQRLGPCVLVCGSPMSAVVGEHFATCEGCGVTTPAQPLRDGTLAEIGDRRLTATEIARMVAYFGLVGTTNVTRIRDRIYTWHKRGRIHRAVDLDRPPAQRYIFADVYIQLVIDQASATPSVETNVKRPPHLCCQTREA